MWVHVALRLKVSLLKHVVLEPGLTEILWSELGAIGVEAIASSLVNKPVNAKNFWVSICCNSVMVRG